MEEVISTMEAVKPGCEPRMTLVILSHRRITTVSSHE